MRIEILLALAIFSLLCLSGLGQEETVEYWLSKGAEEYVNGSLEEALKSFDNATAIDPENATVWFARGLAQSGLGRHAEAISSYNKSIQIDDENADVWYARAGDEKDLGRMNDSLASYDRSLRINPENKFAWYDKGNLLMDLGRYDEALQSFEESIRISPNSPSPWRGKYMALRSLGRTQEAEEAWTKYQDLSYGHISFSENGGQSMEDAIIIMNATGGDDGVGSEYYYLEKRFGSKGVDWDLTLQTLVSDEAGRSYDKMDILLSTGEKKTIYFDITDFYGKGIEKLMEMLGL